MPALPSRKPTRNKESSVHYVGSTKAPSLWGSHGVITDAHPRGRSAGCRAAIIGPSSAGRASYHQCNPYFWVPCFISSVLATHGTLVVGLQCLPHTILPQEPCSPDQLRYFTALYVSCGSELTMVSVA